MLESEPVMTLTTELPSEVEAELLAQAVARGLDLTRYVQQVLRDQILSPALDTLTPGELAEARRQSARDLPLTPPLSDDAISRETIYGVRGQ
jgi:hypothetical protein